MNNTSSAGRKSFKWSSILKYFLQGVLVVAPIAITFYLIYWFVSSIDNLLPIFTSKDQQGNVTTHNYGLGFLIIIAALIVIGLLSTSFITKGIFSLFDDWLERTPGVKFIYSSVKDFFEAFAGNKRKFNKSVLVSLYNNDIYQIGFITNEDASEFGLHDYVTVYIPFSYSLAGAMYLVPSSKVKVVEGISPAHTMKYVISGGVAEVEDSHHHHHGHHSI